MQGAGSAVVGVTLAGTEVKTLVSQSDTVVNVVADDAAAGSGAIILTADTGAIVTGVDWEYLEAGVITDVSPSSGQAGTVVEIAGERMLGGGDDIDSVSPVIP